MIVCVNIWYINLNRNFGLFENSMVVDIRLFKYWGIFNGVIGNNYEFFGFYLFFRVYCGVEFYRLMFSVWFVFDVNCVFIVVKKNVYDFRFYKNM